MIYALRKDLSAFLSHLSKIPENFIIISKGQESYKSIYPAIFIYRDSELRLLEHAFSSYLNKYLSSYKAFEDASDFYQEREDIYIYYLKITDCLKSLEDILTKGRQPYKIKKNDLEKIKIPSKYFLFISGFDYEINWLKENHQLLDNIIIVAFSCKKNKKLAKLLTKIYYG